MKNKLIILNIISYIFLYHILYELVYNFYMEKGDIGVTPLGYILQLSEFKNSGEGLGIIIILISFILNMFVSRILLKYIFKWADVMSTKKLFGKLFIVFIIASTLLIILLLLLAFLTHGSFFFIFIVLYYPMPIMAVIMIPLFKFNQWVTEQFSR